MEFWYQKIVLLGRLRHHLMPFPDPGPNLLELLEAADTKDVAELKWPRTVYSGCVVSATSERKSSSAVPSLPQGSLRNFPGTEQIYPYPCFNRWRTLCNQLLCTAWCRRNVAWQGLGAACEANFQEFLTGILVTILFCSSQFLWKKQSPGWFLCA